MKFNFNSLRTYVVGATIVGAVVFGAFNLLNVPQAKAAFTAPSVSNIPAKNSDGVIKNITAQGISENLSQNGVYSVTYRITTNGGDLSFPLVGAIHHCTQGNGHTSTDGLRFNICEQPDAPYNTFNINLNTANNYTQDISLSTTQVVPMACGSYQSDLFSNTPTPNANGFFYASLKLTGVNCPEPTPTPTPTPSHTPTPTPTPSHTPTPTPTPKPSKTPMPTPTTTPSTIQCPVGKISKVVDSTIICVSQNQNQNQTQTQNNNQNQTVNQNVVANGGNSSSSSSSSSSSNVTINNNPTSTTTVIKEVPVSVTTTTPQVVSQTKGEVKELPKTGLPLAALALGGLLPGGVAFKRFGKKSTEEVSANSIWTEKQLNS